MTELGMRAGGEAVTRPKIVGRIADHLVAQQCGHPLRVAVDGVTASGKTTLAGELAAAVRRRGKPAIQLSMDGFHRRRALRHRQGRDSAVGYYQDAYDFDSFARLVLVPLGPAGDRRYIAGIIDLASDHPIDVEPTQASPDAVLVVAGSFLQRGELRGLWDEVLFVDTSLDVARSRGTYRDADKFDGRAKAEHAFDNRYHAACQLYLDEVDPAARASIVIANDDLANPVLRRIGGTAAATVRLFSYGTLQQPEVQLASFGHHLDGAPDAVPGHRIGWVTIADPDVIAASGSDRHPVVSPTGNSCDSVEGTVFALTPAELAAADAYEVDDYRRVLVRLQSGVRSWIYLAADHG